MGLVLPSGITGQDDPAVWEPFSDDYCGRQAPWPILSLCLVPTLLLLPTDPLPLHQ